MPIERRPLLTAAALALVLLACNQAQSEHQQQSPGTVVDSILPIEEEIRRFRAGIPPGLHADTFTSAAKGRDALVAAFMRALAARDTARLRVLALNEAEFISAYYPESQFARPPRKQSPAFVWFLTQQNSAKGINRALTRFGGQLTPPYTYHCDATPVLAGRNRLWQHCIIEWQADPVRITLFGTIIERNGRFKFVSYANDL
jgi:hypothetical protein